MPGCTPDDHRTSGHSLCKQALSHGSGGEIKPMQAMVFLAFALGVMLSPDTLILLGNTLGHEGYAALSGLLIAGGLHVLTACTYGRLGLHPTASDGESRFLADAYGPLVATVLPLCARVVYTVAATTGILAIAGYVFNEVFVYWFPNLGFSFCLLGMVVGLSLAGPRVATLAQLSYVVLALGGVLVSRPWVCSGGGRFRQGSR